jgi:hypothetical protein
LDISSEGSGHQGQLLGGSYHSFSWLRTRRMISVKIDVPANHMTEDARWDYRVTIRFKNSTVATTANLDEEV